MKQFVRISTALFFLIVGVAHSRQCLARPPVFASAGIQAEIQRSGCRRLLALNESVKLYQPTWLTRLIRREALSWFLGPDKTRAIVFNRADLTRGPSDSAARAPASLGNKNVYHNAQDFPEWKENGMPVAQSGILEAPASQADGSDPDNKAPSGLALVWTLLGVFIGGITLNLTPCVYPLIPVTVSYFGGRSGKSQGKLVAHGLAYIGGLAVTNSTLGVIAALTGGLLGALLQNPLVLTSVAVVLLVFAASLFGFWELRLPHGLTQAASKSYAGYFGSLFMGLTLGIIAAPCIGPLVLGLLTWIASIGSPWFGFIVFMSLSLGLGLPLFILALFAGNLEKLPRSGEWMVWIRKCMGWILVGMAAYFLHPLLSKLIGIIISCVIAVSAGIHLAWLDKSQAAFRGFKWIKHGVGLLCLGSAVFLAWPMLGREPLGVAWQTYSAAVMEQAGQQNRPVIMDFYAAWCVPCRELDEITFHDPRVVAASEQFLMIKVDLTTRDNPEFQKLLQDYDVRGLPTVIFLDRNGRERRDLRLIGFIKPEAFVVHMKKAL
jgi:thiol:disulfide interchange protein DsbD